MKHIDKETASEMEQDCVDAAEAMKADDSGVEDGHDPESATELQALHITISRLTAHLVTKGYGHNAIKRILKGEVVR